MNGRQNAWSEPSRSTNGRRPPGDVVCGPRCLRFILQAVRSEASAPDLVSIVARVQPDLDEGASLSLLKKYLDDQGLFTLAFKPEPNTAIVSPFPALVHLRGNQDDLGHYVVLLPNSDRSNATVWSGLAGPVRLPTWWLAERIDAGAVLVAPRPIEANLAFPATTDFSRRQVGWGILLIAGFLLSVCGLANSRCSLLSGSHSERPLVTIVGKSPT
jgi:ABC-type bacteriocin/lantibiotic exporter with double-glycine peptidase domain